MIKAIYFFGFALLLSGCLVKDKHDGKTISYASLVNRSGVPVRIEVFSSVDSLNGYSISLMPSDSVQISQNIYMGLGKMNSPGFNNMYFAYADSMIITFDDSFVVTHYRDRPLAFSDKHYLLQDTRNLINIANWQQAFDESKWQLTVYYSYTFAEQDYEYAKH